MSEETKKIRLVDDDGNVSTLAIKNGGLQVGSMVADLDSHWEASIPDSLAVFTQLGSRVSSSGRLLKELSIQNTGESVISADVYSSCLEHLNIQAGEVRSIIEKDGFIYILYAGGTLQKVNASTMTIVATVTAASVGTSTKLLADDDYIYVLTNRSDPNPAEITRVGLTLFDVGDTLVLDTGEFSVEQIVLFNGTIYYIPTIATKKVCTVDLATFLTGTKITITGASAFNGLVVDEDTGLLYIAYTNASGDQMVQVEDTTAIGTKSFTITIDPTAAVAFTSNILMINDKLYGATVDTTVPKLYEISKAYFSPQVIWEGTDLFWTADGTTVISLVNGELVILNETDPGSVTASGLTLDLSEAASIKLHYTGEGGGATIDLVFTTSEGNYFSYTFTDTVSIERMLEVDLADFTPTGTPDWSNITSITINSIDVGLTLKIRRLIADGQVAELDKSVVLSNEAELLFTDGDEIYSITDAGDYVEVDAVDLTTLALRALTFETLTNFKDAIYASSGIYIVGGDSNFVETQLLKSTISLVSDSKKLRVDALPSVVSNWNSVCGRLFSTGSLVIIKTLTAEISASGVE